MAGFDRTGPEGLGARTGRQMGKCANNDPGDEEKSEQFGPETRKLMGRGMGRGVGMAAGRAGERGKGKGFWRRSKRCQGGDSYQN